MDTEKEIGVILLAAALTILFVRLNILPFDILWIAIPLFLASASLLLLYRKD